uniref:PHD-type domain-containing protein n=1 Tax=Ascaris lumbricoides TaxID=6252 RepID=A0A9J2PXR9_ASCLU
MTEAERKSFIAYATSRGPGKRQIKPNAAVLLGVSSTNEADDDDDEDFVGQGKFPNVFRREKKFACIFAMVRLWEVKFSMRETLESERSKASPKEDDEPIAYTHGSFDKGEAERVEGREDVQLGAPCIIIKAGLICALCLNQRDVVHKEEVIQCDRCGLAVHESCYMVDNTEDSDSTLSSAVTEPWFCEPCLYGLKSPPYCELCPSRYGAFKRSAVRISTRSYPVIKIYRSVLVNSLILGLLVDNSEVENGQNGKEKSAANKQKWYFADAETVDPRFLTYQRHSNPDIAPRHKQAYANSSFAFKFDCFGCAKCYKQEEERMRILHRRALTPREEKKRLRMLAKHKKLLKNLVGISIAWPEHDNKRPRLLNTSAMFLDLFRDKAAAVGVSDEEFERSFKQVDGAELQFLTPGFSHEFVSYFEARENKVFPKEQSRVKELEAEAVELRKQQSILEKELADSADQHLLVLCDVCKKHYHLACLDPPLRKMPKKNRNCGWECSMCAEESDEDEEQNDDEHSLNESEGSQSARKLRDRTAMSEKRKEEEKTPARGTVMAPLSIDVGEDGGGDGASASSRKASGSPSSLSPSSPIQKRSRVSLKNTIVQRLNGSLLKMALRKSDIGSVGVMKDARRTSLSVGMKRSGTLPPDTQSFKIADKGRFTNGLLAMISPR